MKKNLLLAPLFYVILSVSVSGCGQSDSEKIATQQQQLINSSLKGQEDLKKELAGMSSTSKSSQDKKTEVIDWDKSLNHKK
jgi:hypothetical protein